MKKWMLGISIFGILLLMLAFPKDTLSNARNGLNLWFNTLLPTLLPFLILSGFLVHSGLIQNLSSLIYPIFGKLYAISPEGCYALFAGFLCGFPIGAKVLGDLVRNRKIHPDEAQYLLGICNNVSPSFVITFLITEKLKDPSLILKTVILLYLIPASCGLLRRKRYLIRKQQNPVLLIKNASEDLLSFELLDACIYDAINTLLKIGGYVILFSVLSGIPDKLPFLSSQMTSIGIGFLEITNGVSAITQSFPKETAYKILLPIMGFGGLCALAQTLSVLKGSALKIRPYIKTKAMIAMIILFLTMLT